MPRPQLIDLGRVRIPIDERVALTCELGIHDGWDHIQRLTPLGSTVRQWRVFISTRRVNSTFNQGDLESDSLQPSSESWSRDCFLQTHLGHGTVEQTSSVYHFRWLGEVPNLLGYSPTVNRMKPRLEIETGEHPSRGGSELSPERSHPFPDVRAHYVA